MAHPVDNDTALRDTALNAAHECLAQCDAVIKTARAQVQLCYRHPHLWGTADAMSDLDETLRMAWADVESRILEGLENFTATMKVTLDVTDEELALDRLSHDRECAAELRKG
jgi:hypothetical protein